MSIHIGAPMWNHKCLLENVNKFPHLQLKAHKELVGWSGGTPVPWQGLRFISHLPTLSRYPHQIIPYPSLSLSTWVQIQNFILIFEVWLLWSEFKQCNWISNINIGFRSPTSNFKHSWLLHTLFKYYTCRCFWNPFNVMKNQKKLYFLSQSCLMLIPLSLKCVGHAM